MRGVVRVRFKVADRGRIQRLLLFEGLQDVPGAVLDFGEEGVAGDMVGLGVDHDLAARPVEGEPLLERLDHRHALDRAGLPDPFCPEMDAFIARRRQFADIGRLGAVPALDRVDKGLACRRLQFLEIAVATDNAFALRGLQCRRFVDKAERGGRDRDLALEAGRRPLAVEGGMVAADHGRQQKIGLRRLDTRDRRAEVRDVEREEVDRQNLAAIVLDVFAHPFRGDLAVIVVGRDDVGLLAPQVHGVGHQLLDRLGRGGAGVEGVAVAHAALVEGVVEIERAETAEDRPDRFARGRGDAAMDHVDTVAHGKLLRVLRIELNVRLGIVVDQFDLTAQQAAGGVDFLDRELDGIDHRFAGRGERSRKVVQAAQLDRAVAGARDAANNGRSRQRGAPGNGCTKKLTA